jgi:heptosyltransferase-3
MGWGFPSEEHVSATKKLPCYPCNNNSCKHRQCLEEFTPEENLPVALKLFEIGLAGKDD